MYSRIIAVDISDQGIKILELNHAYEVVRYAHAQLRQGIVEKGIICDTDAFKEKVRAVLRDAKPKPIDLDNESWHSIVNLPESQVFLHDVALPPDISEDDIAAYVTDEAAKVIPYELDHVYLAYHQTKVGDDRHAVIVCAPKESVDNYKHALTEAGIPPVAIGSSFFSLGRSLLPDTFSDANYIIVDIGAHATNIGVFDTDAVATFSARIPRGGTHFTAVLKEQLEIGKREAESLKRKIGVDPQSEDSESVALLQSCLDEIITEVMQVRQYYEEKTGQPITEVVLTGGSALMPGIITYFGEKLGVKTTCADPFLKLRGHNIIDAKTPKVYFANVVGLGLRVVNDDLPGIDLLAVYSKDPSNNKRFSLHFIHFRQLSKIEHQLRLYSKKLVSLWQQVHFRPLQQSNAKLVRAAVFALIAVLGLWWVVNTYT